MTPAEILKRRVPGIHQITETSSITIVDVWEPKEDGLDTLETQRRVSVINITLSKEPLDTHHIGYQPPLPEDQVGPHTSSAWDYQRQLALLASEV